MAVRCHRCRGALTSGDTFCHDRVLCFNRVCARCRDCFSCSKLRSHVPPPSDAPNEKDGAYRPAASEEVSSAWGVGR